ncbi:hypothetical protein H0H87_011512 [Tephrocybe sp. NHM501043]|nr:hypothetical protein H0H87_011512 [Tephrocybe sp. NHM501043]
MPGDLLALCDEQGHFTDASICDTATGHPVEDIDFGTFMASIICGTQPLLAAINLVSSPATPMGLAQYGVTPMPYVRDPAYHLEHFQGQIKS